MMIEIVVYETTDGKRPFEKWLSNVDAQARDRIRIAIARLADGNTGSLKSIGDGVHEIRLTFGSGWRIYLGQEDARLIILLHGGTKRRQNNDIAKAKELWRQYQQEKN